jgi:hypothetical protein
MAVDIALHIAYAVGVAWTGQAHVGIQSLTTVNDALACSWIDHGFQRVVVQPLPCEPQSRTVV